MADKEIRTLKAARIITKKLASGALTPSFAKLYSQHTRLDSGQPGLSGWAANEADKRLEDAIRLVDAALYKRSLLSGETSSVRAQAS